MIGDLPWAGWRSGTRRAVGCRCVMHELGSAIMGDEARRADGRGHGRGGGREPGGPGGPGRLRAPDGPRRSRAGHVGQPQRAARRADGDHPVRHAVRADDPGGHLPGPHVGRRTAVRPAALDGDTDAPGAVPGQPRRGDRAHPLPVRGGAVHRAGRTARRALRDGRARRAGAGRAVRQVRHRAARGRRGRRAGRAQRGDPAQPRRAHLRADPGPRLRAGRAPWSGWPGCTGTPGWPGTPQTLSESDLDRGQRCGTGAALRRDRRTGRSRPGAAPPGPRGGQAQ